MSYNYTTTGDTTWRSWTSADNSTNGTYNYNIVYLSTGGYTMSDNNLYIGAPYQFVGEYAGCEIITTIPEETEEQKQIRLVLEEVARETEKLRLEKQKQAEEKALQLLLDNLEENQVEIFKKTGCFVVTGQSGKKYKINKGRVRNVEELREDGTSERRMCFHPELFVPDHDTMLAQKLMLELNEPEARRIANFS